MQSFLSTIVRNTIGAKLYFKDIKIFLKYHLAHKKLIKTDIEILYITILLRNESVFENK